jgi:AraC-like DNA-binding protein
MKRMTESGTATFSNPDEYPAGIGNATVSLVLTGRGDFKARLTWLKFRHLHAVRSRENLPRIAHVSLSAGRVFASLSFKSETPTTWSGVELRPGDVIFHSLGERGHQWTKGPNQWGLISLPPAQLAAYGKVLTGSELTPPLAGRVLRPAPPAAANLRRILSSACRVAETKPEIIVQQEAGRALEQELIHALVTCLTANDAHRSLATKRHHAEIMLRFEDALTAHVYRQSGIPALCAAIDVSERTLQACCMEFLGMSPNRYLRLRRLNMVRAALRRADPESASVAEIAQRYQFSDLGRFAAVYRAIFGEMPSATLRDDRSKCLKPSGS